MSRDRGDGTDAKSRPEHVGQVMERFLEAKGVARQVRRQGAVERWAEIVGESISQVTRARSVSEGTLFVEVRSSPWLMELEMLKGDVLGRVNAALGDASIDRIVFVLGEEMRAGGTTER